MIYKCCHCMATFTEPFSYTERENLDGENGWEVRKINTCPWCGCEEYDEIFEEEN